MAGNPWGVRDRSARSHLDSYVGGYGPEDYWGHGKQGGLAIFIDDKALQTFDDRMQRLDIDRMYKIDSGKAVSAMVSELRREAMPRSPYLYGVLRNAHYSETRYVSGHWVGVVTIDPSVVHHILGGRPANYGARIHGEDRPWFEWTVVQEADRIIDKHSGEIVSAYLQLWGDGGSGSVMTSSSIF